MRFGLLGGERAVRKQNRDKKFAHTGGVFGKTKAVVVSEMPMPETVNGREADFSTALASQPPAATVRPNDHFPNAAHVVNSPPI